MRRAVRHRLPLYRISGEHAMADKIDPYREALVVEMVTVWPEDVPELPPEDRQRLEARLHADPRRASQVEYVRLHTGFCRRITVTAEDVARFTAESTAASAPVSGGTP